jgi:hypothetical protein
LQTDLQLAVDAITQLTVGPTAETRLRARVIDQLLPNLNDEDKDQIAEELENVQNTQQREQQINEEIAAALTEDEDEEPQQEVAPEPEA